MQWVKVSGTVTLLSHLPRAHVVRTLPRAMFGVLILRPLLFLERFSPGERAPRGRGAARGLCQHPEPHFPSSPELLSAHKTPSSPFEEGNPAAGLAQRGWMLQILTLLDRHVPASRLHRGTGSLLLLGQGRASLRLRFICPVVCSGLVSLPSGLDVSQASASLSLDLHAALSNLSI